VTPLVAIAAVVVFALFCLGLFMLATFDDPIPESRLVADDEPYGADGHLRRDRRTGRPLLRRSTENPLQPVDQEAWIKPERWRAR